MSIPFSRYVRIVSGVAGNSGVPQRDLIGRLITQNVLLDPNTVLEFDNAADVASFFGDGSEEALRAAFYFSWTSPAVTAARSISFSRYTPTGAQASIFGDSDSTASLATLQAIANGDITLQIGEPSMSNPAITVGGIDLTAATSFADVAVAVQAALNAETDPNLTGSLVSYDPTRSSFVFSSGVISDTKITITGGTLGAGLGWMGANTLFVSGQVAQSAVDAVQRSIDLSDNFGSFAFMGGADLSPTLIEQVASFNAGLNVRFQYMVPVRDMAAVGSLVPQLLGFAGTAVTFSPLLDEWPEMVPMIVLAATDYSRNNATMNYMFKQFGGLTASVTTASQASQLDAARVNYYGQTQTAGTRIEFYQRGFLMGGVADPLDMNVYGNEQWFKDKCGTDLMGLLLAMPRVPANASGRGMILATLQDSIDQAVRNGTISIDKPLTTENRLFITQQTGDPLAWQQVQSTGYWVDARVERVPNTAPPEWRAVYQIIYAKDDAIRSVEGTHFLI